MKRIWLILCLVLVSVVGCRSLTRQEINEANQAREEAIVVEARDFFIEAGGSVEDFPALFDTTQPRETRLEEARGVIGLLVKADAPPSLIYKIVMYLSIMLSEAEADCEYGED